MKIIFALSGPPGAGKTTRYHSDENLRRHLLVDIASVYREYDSILPKAAFSEFLARIESVLETQEAVVIEAMLPPRGWQRDWLGYIAEMNGAKVEYIELHDVPYDVCRERIKEDYQEDLRNAESYAERHVAMTRYQARKKILDHYERIDRYAQPATV